MLAQSFANEMLREMDAVRGTGMTEVRVRGWGGSKGPCILEQQRYGCSRLLAHMRGRYMRITGTLIPLCPHPAALFPHPPSLHQLHACDCILLKNLIPDFRIPFLLQLFSRTTLTFIGFMIVAVGNYLMFLLYDCVASTAGECTAAAKAPAAAETKTTVAPAAPAATVTV